jgi:biopolymer transport protein ExbD
MKKYIISIFTVLLGIFMTSSAIASTNITLSPSALKVVKGQKVEVIVYVNANGTKNGTVKTNIEFPADLLEVTSFTQPSAWMSIKQDKYDLEDNTNGVLI